MAPTTNKKRKWPTKDVPVVSTENQPLTKKGCTFTRIDGINGEQTITIKVPGDKDTSASSSKSKELVTRQAPAVKFKAAVTPQTPRSNKGKLPSVSKPRTPITRSKKQQLLSVQELSTPDVQHSRQDPRIVPFARKWSNNDELRILRGLQEHRELYGKQPDWAVLYDKITRDGNFDNQHAGIPEFKGKVHKLLRMYKKMVDMNVPKGDDHRIELFRIACSVWGDHASNAHAHGADVDADIDANAVAALNKNAHGLAAPLGAHAGVVASPAAPAPATPFAAQAGTGASPNALAAPATVGMALPVKRAVSSPAAFASRAALARASPAALAHASPAAHAHAMLLPSGTTTASSCAANNREPSQWLSVVLRCGSRVAFLVAFAALMSPGWRKGGYKEFMELGGLLP